MKELLTEWRKFVNEYEDVYDRESQPEISLPNQIQHWVI